MTKPISDFDALRKHGILSSVSGFPFLFMFGFAWIAAGGLSYAVSVNIAVWIYPLAGVPAVFAAIALERRMGYVPPPKPDPLLPLGLQILFIQIVAFPAVALVWDLAPPYVPVAFAAVVGAHFLPFQWIYRTRLYGVLGVLVAVGPYILVILFGEDAMHYTGFFVGGILLVGAFIARAHARATWYESQQAAQQGDAADGAARRN